MFGIGVRVTEAALYLSIPMLQVYFATITRHVLQAISSGDVKLEYAGYVKCRFRK
jgi:hypothetical protein